MTVRTSVVPRALCALAAFVLAAFALAVPLAAQQPGTVAGTVVEQTSREPVAGALVRLANTRLSAVTGENGRYVIANVPAGTYTVEVRRFGFAPREQPNVTVSAAAVTTVNPVLSAVMLQLQEVVVTGVVDPIEGVKNPLSITKLTSDDLPVATTNAITTLQGKVPAANVVKSGRPGAGVSILLRTPKSIERSNSPMFVVDGVIVGQPNIFGGSSADLESLDIESVEVIKGAAAASIYGSRAAAGVISITTSRGKNLPENTTRITARSEYGLSQLPKEIAVTRHHYFRTNAEGQFIDAQGRPTDRATQRVAKPIRIMDEPYGVPLYNNQRAFYRPGDFLSNSVSIGRNTQGTNFLATFNNLNEKGTLVTNDGFKRNNFRINLDHNLRENVGIAISGYHMRSHRDDLSGSPFFDLITMPPDVNLNARDENGYYIQQPDSTVQIENPIWRQTSRDNYTNRVRTQASGEARYSPLSWLTLAGQLSYDRSEVHEHVYVPKGTPAIGGTENDGSLERDQEFTDALNAYVSSTAHRQFGQLNARVTVRGLIEREKSDRVEAVGTNFIVRDVPDLTVTRDRTVNTSFQEIRSSGYFVQTGLDYSGKYVGDFLVRRDGSSLFGPEERWHWYYRAAVAYRMSQEPWWPFKRALNEFKLRAAQGTAGGRPEFTDQYETYAVSLTGVSRDVLGNERLKPEYSRETEVGIDLIALNRYSLQLTYARQVTLDQVIAIPQAAVSGYTSQRQNAGRIQGSTWEGTLEAQIYNKGRTSWSATLIADRSRDKVTEWKRNCFATGISFRCQGVTLGTIHGRRVLTSGLQLPSRHAGSADAFQVNDDGYLVPVGRGNHYQDGLWGTTVTIDGTPYQWGLPIFLEDANGNPAVVPLGRSLPDGHIGFANHVRWRGVTLYGLLDWQIGGNTYNNNRQRMYQHERHGDLDQSGKPEQLKKPTEYYFRLYNSNTTTSHFVEDGSFLKLRELSAKYTFSESQMRRLRLARTGLEQMSLGVIGRNVKTWSRYTGFDPEVGTPLSRNDDQEYPNSRTWTFSLQLVF